MSKFFTCTKEFKTEAKENCTIFLESWYKSGCANDCNKEAKENLVYFDQKMPKNGPCQRP